MTELRGIMLAHNLALGKVIFEYDSSLVVNFVTRGSTSNLLLKSLLQEILSLVRLTDWQMQIKHVSCEANMCADFLAKHGISLFTLLVLC